MTSAPVEPAPLPSIDSLLPPAMAEKAESVGVAKAALPLGKLVVLSGLAGAFIALGAAFATNTLAGAASLPFGVARLLAGITFSLGLMLVVVGGAELFTGNNVLIMACASRRITWQALLRNWGVTFCGNFAGALLTALLMFVSGQYRFGKGSVGLVALEIAEHKCSLAPLEAVALGVLCNALVCLAVWLCYSARTTTDRVLCIVPPIAAFVALGFEHSIANIYLIPIGWLVVNFAPAEFWSAIGRVPGDFPSITAGRFLLVNLLPVTLGNILGGAGLVGLVYWLVYARRAETRDKG